MNCNNCLLGLIMRRVQTQKSILLCFQQFDGKKHSESSLTKRFDYTRLSNAKSPTHWSNAQPHLKFYVLHFWIHKCLNIASNQRSPISPCLQCHLHCPLIV
uniref:Uncharacterized protein n=1 Tax=Rhizophora mucronata TaxID=61149 RepID=A0A2P2PB44_RHIMU